MELRERLQNLQADNSTINIACLVLSLAPCVPSESFNPSKVHLLLQLTIIMPPTLATAVAGGVMFWGFFRPCVHPRECVGTPGGSFITFGTNVPFDSKMN